MKNQSQEYYTPIQLKIPVDMERMIEADDPVYSFQEVLSHMDLKKYFVEEEEHKTGRPEYGAETLLKVILFAFMEEGYESTRKIKKLCRTDIRFMWLLDGKKAPSHMTISNFINHELKAGIEEIFRDINAYIFEKESVDLRHVYIDGTKITANANRYSWVWKKSCETSRKKVFVKVSEVLEAMNHSGIELQGVTFGQREEYAIEYLEYILQEYAKIMALEPEKVVRGRGHRKSLALRLYDKLLEYVKRLKCYAKHIEICGEKRNSYSKTDKDARLCASSGTIWVTISCCLRTICSWGSATNISPYTTSGSMPLTWIVSHRSWNAFSKTMVIIQSTLWAMPGMAVTITTSSARNMA